MSFPFAEIVKGFAAGGNKVEGALALLESLWGAANAVYDVVMATKAEEADAALGRLNAQIERVQPLATGLAAIVKADQEAALQALKDKFGSTQP